MYIAGTRNFNDVMDWAKIPLGTFDKSAIYKNAETGSNLVTNLRGFNDLSTSLKPFDIENTGAL